MPFFLNTHIHHFCCLRFRSRIGSVLSVSEPRIIFSGIYISDRSSRARQKFEPESYLPKKQCYWTRPSSRKTRWTPSLLDSCKRAIFQRQKKTIRLHRGTILYHLSQRVDASTSNRKLLNIDTTVQNKEYYVKILFMVFERGKRSAQ